MQKKEIEEDEDEDHQEGIVADIEDQEDALKDDDLKLTVTKKKNEDSDEDI